MTGFLSRLAAKTLGQVPLAQPLRLSKFSGGETLDNANVNTPQEAEGAPPAATSPPAPPAPTGRPFPHLQPILTEAKGPFPERDTRAQRDAATPEWPGQSPPSMGVPFGLETPVDLKSPSPAGIPPHLVSSTRPPQLVPSEPVEKEFPVPNPASFPASREPFVLPATDTPYPDPPPILVETSPPQPFTPFLHSTEPSEDSPAQPRTSPSAAVVRPVDAQPRQELGEFARRVPGLPPQKEPLKETPTFRITIGRVEVRAISPPQPVHAPPSPRPRTPSLSLNDYLKQRNNGK